MYTVHTQTEKYTESILMHKCMHSVFVSSDPSDPKLFIKGVIKVPPNRQQQRKHSFSREDAPVAELNLIAQGCCCCCQCCCSVIVLMHMQHFT